MKKLRCIIVLLLATIPFSTFAETGTISLQQGLEGYSGCEDQELRNTEGNFGQGPDEGILVVSEL